VVEGTARRKVVRARDRAEVVQDDLVVEEPMEIRLGGEPLAVVMRTPGAEEDLTLGFLITEGIITAPESVRSIEALGAGRWDVRLHDEHLVDPEQFKRNFYSTSSCGVCGKASIDAIRVGGAVPPPGPSLSRSVLTGLPERLLAHQSAFHLTGGLHAAGAFDATGEMIAVCEDIGRHNAVDKLVGRLAARSWPLPPLGVVVSGRVSFEVAQKAAVAGISIVCGVSAASTLAVDLAEEFRMTLVGFLRGGGYTIYTDDGRIDRE
jgi:FdhD protein